MEKQKYICKLPTNGHQVGDEVFLTKEEADNANAGEAEPRYVLAESQEAPKDDAEKKDETSTADNGSASEGASDTGPTEPPPAK